MKQTTPFTVEVRKKRRMQQHELSPSRALKKTDETRSAPEGENTAPNEITPQNDPAAHRPRTR